MTDLIIPTLAGLAALAIGLKLPDIDLAPLLWRHRSAFTHGPLWALVVPSLPLPGWAVYVPFGLLLGIAIHLLFDCLPRRWQGMARVNLKPIPVTFSAGASLLYLVGSTLYTAWVVRNISPL